jgi:Polyketide cyclase / dehydrase and lipid transport
VRTNCGVPPESKPPVRLLFLSALLSLAQATRAADFSASTPQDDIDVSVSLDAAEQSGSANASVRMHASREVVWSLIISCPEAMSMIPGLIACNVLETAADQSWQRIRHVMSYSWYVPTVTYEMRASYQKPVHVAIERVSGDLRILSGSWDLQEDGAYTIARYKLDLAPGFWVPRWVVHAALKRDLPKMLRSLRSRAEALQVSQP